MYRIPQSSPKTRMAPRLSSGFTLIELLTVIAIIAILAGISVGVASAVKESQARSRATAEIAIIAQALEQFKSDTGDYPWTSFRYSSNNRGSALGGGEELFQALLGWRKFTNNNGEVSFELKDLDEVPTNGPEQYVDVSRLTYANEASLGEDGEVFEYNPEISVKLSPPTELSFIDPWGNPYVYVYYRSSAQWDNFGYLLYSMGPDMEDVATGPDGVLTDLIRNEGANADNIYAGE